MRDSLHPSSLDDALKVNGQPVGPKRDGLSYGDIEVGTATAYK